MTDDTRRGISQLAALSICLGTLLILGVPFTLAWWMTAFIGVSMQVVLNRYFKTIPLLIGGTMNGIAIFANGGKMPVLNPPAGWTLTSIHQPMTAATHVKFLCDNYMVGHLVIASIGDFFILVIFPLTILGFYVYNRFKSRRNAQIQNV